MRHAVNWSNGRLDLTADEPVAGSPRDDCDAVGAECDDISISADCRLQQQQQQRNAGQTAWRLVACAVPCPALPRRAAT